MAWQETLGKMAEMRQAFIQSEIGQMLGQEWDNARLTLATTFDTRLRTMETLYSRDVSHGIIIQHDGIPPMGPDPQPEQPMGPSPQPEPTPSMEPGR